MFHIRSMESRDLTAIRQFTDREIGANYYSADELEGIFKRSQKNGVMCSLVLTNDQDEIVGIRFTYPPGQWEHGKGNGLEPHKWPHAMKDTAYFQSIFLSNKVQGDGWGAKISMQSLERLKKVGAKGVVCHSWKESPNNSSTRYLLKLGFEPVGEHKLYWKDLDYNCTRCLKPPCQCTAQEMYLDLERNS